MKKALLVVLFSYGVLLALFVLAAYILPILRMKIVGGFTVGDIAVVLAVPIYGVLIYTAGLYIKRVTCRCGSRNA